MVVGGSSSWWVRTSHGGSGRPGWISRPPRGGAGSGRSQPRASQAGCSREPRSVLRNALASRRREERRAGWRPRNFAAVAVRCGPTLLLYTTAYGRTTGPTFRLAFQFPFAEFPANLHNFGRLHRALANTGAAANVADG